MRDGNTAFLLLICKLMEKTEKNSSYTEAETIILACYEPVNEENEE